LERVDIRKEKHCAWAAAGKHVILIMEDRILKQTIVGNDGEEK
jgi:hypothetical protein